MGVTKKYFYNESQLNFSNACKALGHPARITIIEHLAKNKHINCQELGEIIKLSQSNISRHCQILHECGLIGYEVRGNQCLYRLNQDRIEKLLDYIDSFNKIPFTHTNRVYFPAQYAY